MQRCEKHHQMYENTIHRTANIRANIAQQFGIEISGDDRDDDDDNNDDENNNSSSSNGMRDDTATK